MPIKYKHALSLAVLCAAAAGVTVSATTCASVTGTGAEDKCNGLDWCFWELQDPSAGFCADLCHMSLNTDLGAHHLVAETICIVSTGVGDTHCIESCTATPTNNDEAKCGAGLTCFYTISTTTCAAITATGCSRFDISGYIGSGTPAVKLDEDACGRELLCTSSKGGTACGTIIGGDCDAYNTSDRGTYHKEGCDADGLCDATSDACYHKCPNIITGETDCNAAKGCRYDLTSDRCATYCHYFSTVDSGSIDEDKCEAIDGCKVHKTKICVDDCENLIDARCSDAMRCGFDANDDCEDIVLGKCTTYDDAEIVDSAKVFDKEACGDENPCRMNSEGTGCVTISAGDCTSYETSQYSAADAVDDDVDSGQKFSASACYEDERCSPDDKEEHEKCNIITPGNCVEYDTSSSFDGVRVYHKAACGSDEKCQPNNGKDACVVKCGAYTGTSTDDDIGACDGKKGCRWDSTGDGGCFETCGDYTPASSSAIDAFLPCENSAFFCKKDDKVCVDDCEAIGTNKPDCSASPSCKWDVDTGKCADITPGTCDDYNLSGYNVTEDEWIYHAYGCDVDKKCKANNNNSACITDCSGLKEAKCDEENGCAWDSDATEPHCYADCGYYTESGAGSGIDKRACAAEPKCKLNGDDSVCIYKCTEYNGDDFCETASMCMVDPEDEGKCVEVENCSHYNKSNNNSIDIDACGNAAHCEANTNNTTCIDKCSFYTESSECDSVDACEYDGTVCGDQPEETTTSKPVVEVEPEFPEFTYTISEVCEGLEVTECEAVADDACTYVTLVATCIDTDSIAPSVLEESGALGVTPALGLSIVSAVIGIFIAQ